MPKGQLAWIMAFIGGMGGIELILSKEARLSKESHVLGHDPRSHLVVSLIGCGP